MSNYTVEFDETHGRYRIVGAVMPLGHRCGYIGVDEKHPLFGKDYGVELPADKFGHLLDRNVEDERAPWAEMLVASGAEGHYRLSILIDVHGGLTFSSGKKQSTYPVKKRNKRWWFGFDCNHLHDSENPKSQEYVYAECQKMIEQFKMFENVDKE